MLNKAGYIILAILVLCTTTGIVVNQHYSKGELYSSSFYSEPDSCCSQDNEEHLNTCHEQTMVYKVKDYFRASFPIKISVQFSFIIQTIKITELFNFTKPVTEFSNPEYKPIPPKIPTSEFIQVFIL